MDRLKVIYDYKLVRALFNVFLRYLLDDRMLRTASMLQNHRFVSFLTERRWTMRARLVGHFQAPLGPSPSVKRDKS